MFLDNTELVFAGAVTRSLEAVCVIDFMSGKVIAQCGSYNAGLDACRAANDEAESIRFFVVPWAIGVKSRRVPAREE